MAKPKVVTDAAESDEVELPEEEEKAAKKSGGSFLSRGGKAELR